MAEEPKVLFEVDVAKILAKLHLAGVIAGGVDTNSFFVNTGIKNDNSSATPENPGNVEFDLNDKQDEFEVGCVTEIEFTSVMSGENAKDNPVAAALKITSEIGTVTSETTEKNEKEPLTDKDATQKNDDELNKKFSELKAQLEKLKSDNKDLFGSNKDVAALVDVILKSKDAQAFSQENNDDFKKNLKDAEDKLNANSSDDSKNEYDSAVNEAKDRAIEHLKKYFETFAGKESVNKGIDNPKQIVISDTIKSSSDKQLVANYEIQPISEAEAAKKKEEITAGVGKKFKQKLCFVVKYSIRVDK